ncbi:MAG TPA: molybdopterin molybdotransferase MoeA [Puia sp.]
MITYQQAQEIVAKQARSFGQEKIGLEQAYGRVLAATVLADRDYPPFHRATMDGYAIRYNDWEAGLRQFEVAEILYAGAAATRPLTRGKCYKIMTGAAVPPDADTVIRREDTDDPAPSEEETASSVKSSHNVTILLSSCQRFQNIARQGEDLQAGDIAIGVPSRIGPAVIGILASLGNNECLVEKLPRVALFTTGNEVVPVDAPVSAIQIRNSNRWILQSLLKEWGISPVLYEHLPDSKDALRYSLAKAITSADIILLSGGVSAGDADYVPGILKELGVKPLFHKIAIRPGKPVWCGITPGGAMVFALPGNPFSGMVGFVLLIKHYLHACFGLAAPMPMGLPLDSGRKKKTPLDEFFPVQFIGSPARLQTIDINGSGDSRLGLYANALALHPADSGDLPEGTNTLYYSL